ncbi:MAG: aminoglycoside phosphotransferase family protein [Chthonomonadales bacterium]
MSRIVARFLRSSGVVPDITPNTRLNFVKLRSLTSVLSLVFVDDDPIPRYVLKVERDRARAPKLASACKALRIVAANPILRRSVPEVVYCGTPGGEGGLFATLETFLDGPMLAIPLGIARDRGDHQEAARLLKAAYQWLATFHATFPDGEPPSLAARFLEHLRTHIGSHMMEAALGLDLSERLEDLAGSLCPEVLPWGRVHGDFNPYNVILKKAQPLEIGVIDWDASEPGCQLFDAFQMAVVGHLLPAPPENRIGLQDALWQGSDPEGAVFRQALARYAQNDQSFEHFRTAYSLYLAYMMANLQVQAGTRPEPMIDFWKTLLTAELRRRA